MSGAFDLEPINGYSNHEIYNTVQSYNTIHNVYSIVLLNAKFFKYYLDLIILIWPMISYDLYLNIEMFCFYRYAEKNCCPRKFILIF